MKRVTYDEFRKACRYLIRNKVPHTNLQPIESMHCMQFTTVDEDNKPILIAGSIGNGRIYSVDEDFWQQVIAHNHRSKT